MASKKFQYGGVKDSWDEVVFKLGQAREAQLAARAKLEELVRQEEYSGRKYQRLKREEVKCIVRVLELEEIEINLRRIAGVKISEPTGRRGGDA